MIPKSTLLLVCLLGCIFHSCHSEPPPEWQGGSGGGGSFFPIRNSGPSKIFEWIGSRFSKLPYLLPKFPTFPKYNLPQKLPSYQVIIPEPPTQEQLNDFYSGPSQHTSYNHDDQKERPYESQSGFNFLQHNEEPNFQEGPSQHGPSQQGSHQHGSPQQGSHQHGPPQQESYQHGPPQQGSHQHGSPQGSHQHGSPQGSHQHGSPQGSHQHGPPQQGSYQNGPPQKGSHQHELPQQGSHQHGSPQHGPPPQTYQNQQQTYTQNDFNNNQNYQKPSDYNPIQKEIGLHHNVKQPPFKAKESPIEVFPSTMVAYNKETYPPGLEEGWRDMTYIGQQNQIPSKPISSLSPPSSSYDQPPPSKAAVKLVPMTPHSTGPDYFNTAYKHEDAYSSSGSSYNEPTEFNTFGAALSSAQQKPYQYQTYSSPSPSYESQGQQQQPYNQVGFDYNPQSLPSQFNQVGFDSSSQQGFSQNDYSLHQQAIPSPTNTVPQYVVPPTESYTSASTGRPTPKGRGYVDHLPGVKIQQSQDSGNPVFEIIADANAPDYGGHPFDISKLISMIEPGAQLIDTQVSEEASEKKEVIQRPPKGMSTNPKSSIDDEPTLGSPFYEYDTNPYNKLTPTFDKKTFDKFNSSSLKDLLNFFQLTGGKGYVVVEKKGPKKPLDLFDDSTNDLTIDEGPTKLNITANTFPFMFPMTRELQTTTTPLPPTTTTPPPPIVFFAVRTTTQHPNHNYKRKYPYVVRSRPLTAVYQDLDFADSNNVKSIAITVTPPTISKSKKVNYSFKLTRKYPTTSIPWTMLKNTTDNSLVPVTRKSMAISRSTYKSNQPAPVYKKSKLPSSQST